MSEATPTVITKYTYEDLWGLFYRYQQACKSSHDAKLIKELFVRMVAILHLEKGKTYSSIPHAD